MGVEGGEFRLASLDKDKPEITAVETWLFYIALQLPSRPSVPEVRALHRLKSFGGHSEVPALGCEGNHFYVYPANGELRYLSAYRIDLARCCESARYETDNLGVQELLSSSVDSQKVEV